ncbi:MAG: NaeI family type II restriction endonuclease [Proteobacteria bacterium]|nr:NaeI family type II restriction endonuclease [Pseudomonadota bacterium]
MNHKTFHNKLLNQLSNCGDLATEIVKAVIELIDPVRTSRKSISDLEKTEKTYIGTKVEIILRYKLGVIRGPTQDCIIDDVEFDVKCTVGQNWMIPREAVNHFCLVVKIDWVAQKISVGTFFAALENLSEGQNQDKKRTISKEGKSTIKWIYHNEPFQIPKAVPYVDWREAS